MSSSGSIRRVIRQVEVVTTSHGRTTRVKACRCRSSGEGHNTMRV